MKDSSYILPRCLTSYKFYMSKVNEFFECGYANIELKNKLIELKNIRDDLILDVKEDIEQTKIELNRRKKLIENQYDEFDEYDCDNIKFIELANQVANDRYSIIESVLKNVKNLDNKLGIIKYEQ